MPEKVKPLIVIEPSYIVYRLVEYDCGNCEGCGKKCKDKKVERSEK